MKIIKKINNGAAIGIDSAGREVVVLGRGVGFPEVPYILDDLSKIQRTYYGIDSQYFGLLSEIPPDIFLLSSRVMEQAKLKIDCELNPNLAFTLADHINFAIERYRKQMQVGLPYSYELEIEFPEDFEVAKYALEVIGQDMDVNLPEDEITSIALHIINAHVGKSNKNRDALKKTIREITAIVEGAYHINIDKKEFTYYRFTNHVKRFLQRKSNGVQVDDTPESLFQFFVGDYPKVHECVREIDDYLLTEIGSRCSKEELTYLMIHIKALTTD